MSLFKRLSRTERKERKLTELEMILKFNPRYFEEKEIHKIRMAVKSYM